MRRTLILFSSLFALAIATTTGIKAQSTQEEFGKCGYYADALHGRKTASGELYDKTLLTCAHKTLPFGTNLRVTRLDNKKSVVVRVNDRGPFIDGYVVDISRKAAETIGLIRDGVTKVKIEVVNSTTSATSVAPATYSANTRTLPQSLEPATTATTARSISVSEAKAQLLKPQKEVVPATKAVAPVVYSAPSTTQPAPVSPEATNVQVSELYQIDLKAVRGKGFGLQMAVLSTTENLFQQIAKLQETWPGKVIINHEESAGVVIFKLILGPYATRKEAEAQQKKAATKGFKKTFVVAFE